MAQHRVWQFKELILDYDLSSTGGSITFSTDMPGGTLTPRTIPGPGGSIPVSSRTTQAWPLDGLEGSLYRVVAQPTSPGRLLLFGGHVKARPIGVYLDGARGEFWDSGPQSPGV